MFKIGEFSRIGQVSVRMLRHYDHLGLLRPSQTDRFTGYRYYTIDQLPQLHRIVALNNLGITLEQITELVNQSADAGRLQQLLIQRREQLERELAERTFQLRSLTARLAALDHTSAHEVVVRPLEAITVAGIRDNVADVAAMGAACAALYARLYHALARRRITPAGTEMTIYHTEEYVEHDLLTEAGVVIDPSQQPLGADDDLIVHTLPPVPSAATLVFAGTYVEIEHAVLSLLGWVAARGLHPAGPLREMHRSGPAHAHGAPGAAVIELQLPVRPA